MFEHVWPPGEVTSCQKGIKIGDHFDELHRPLLVVFCDLWPRGAHVSDAEMPKVKYTQKFRDEWLKDPMLCKWLVCKTKQDGTKVAECKYCRCELGTKYSDLGKHRLTEKHKAAATSTAATQSQINFPRAATSSSNVAEGRVALFVAEHCSIATADHLSGVIKKSFSDSHTARNYRMKRTKCASLLKNVLYPHFKDDLSADIGGSKFSVIIDESTDVSVSKLLSIAIIYYSTAKAKIVTSFLSLCVLEACTADGIVEGIKHTLKEFKIDLNNMVGIGTDNASVMTGVNNGVHQKLKAEVPNLILVRCVCHSLQLAISAAVADCLPRSLEYLVSETYN